MVQTDAPMKIIQSTILSVFVLLLLPLAAFGQADAKDSQAEAARKFPELAKAGSKFN